MINLTNQNKEKVQFSYPQPLETTRLRSRALLNDDIPIWSRFFEDKEAVEFLPSFGLTTNMERAEHWIKKQLKRYAENRYGLQMLIDKKSNAIVGQCGLLQQEVDGREELEVGYHIFKKYWGQGYAPEAAKGFFSLAFENNLSDSVISIIDVGNVKSERVAEKNGLVKEKQTKWMDFDVNIYRIKNWNN